MKNDEGDAQGIQGRDGLGAPQGRGNGLGIFEHRQHQHVQRDAYIGKGAPGHPGDVAGQVVPEGEPQDHQQRLPARHPVKHQGHEAQEYVLRGDAAAEQEIRQSIARHRGREQEKQERYGGKIQTLHLLMGHRGKRRGSFRP